MSASRRGFLRSFASVPALSPELITARGREALAAEHPFLEPPFVPPPEAEEIRISSNENPLGPGNAAIEALLGEFDQISRYPFGSRKSSGMLREQLAKEFRAEPENVVMGAGSSEILRNAVRAFTSPDRPLVTADPSFENPVDTANLLGHPIESIPVDREFRLDLDEMAKASRGAGLVFLCNPNNPTGTVHSYRAVESFVERVQSDSPQTVILIDEAYHEYVTSRGYRTSAPLALARPGVFISRTFSKAYGMAGLRIGYAIGQPQTIRRLSRHKLNYNVNVLGVAAASKAFSDLAHLASEKDRNSEVKKFTTEFFESKGHSAADSETNFIFVNIGRPAKEFREACEKHNVRVGRDFPPFENTHARISLGTMDEMRRAVEVFETVLSMPAGSPVEEGRPGEKGGVSQDTA